MRSTRLSEAFRKKDRQSAFLSDTSFSLCFLNGRSAYWTESKWLTFQLSSLRALWRALLFLSSASHCCWDQSTPVKASLWWKHTHMKTCMNAACSQIRRHSLAHSECCCPSGLCSGPAVTSSLCLCCRWCASSLGYPSFCWRGTSPLFQLPGKSEREQFTAPNESRGRLQIS